MPNGMPVLNFRIHPELLEAAERHARKAGMSVRAWARQLIEEKTGVRIDHSKHGLAASDIETRRRIASIGGTAKAAAIRKAKRSKTKAAGRIE